MVKRVNFSGLHGCQNFGVSTSAWEFTEGDSSALREVEQQEKFEIEDQNFAYDQLIKNIREFTVKYQRNNLNIKGRKIREYREKIRFFIDTLSDEDKLHLFSPEDRDLLIEIMIEDAKSAWEFMHVGWLKYGESMTSR